MNRAAKKRVGILISGRGSNMMSLIEASNAPGYPAQIAIVISNRPEAAGLARARDAGIEAIGLDHRAFTTRDAFDEAMHAALMTARVEIVCSAGFMRILSSRFVERWRDRLLNIHPSLLPLFKGLHPQRQALEAGVKISGCSVHFVRPEMDSGPIVAQAAVPVLEGDTEATLEARILQAEHVLYPSALRLVADGQVRIEHERVLISTAAKTSEASDFLHPYP